MSATPASVKITVRQNTLDNQLYDVAKKWISGNEELSAVTLIPLATNLMAYAQKKSTSNSGAQKKAAVINVVNRIIEDCVAEDKQQQIMELANSILPTAIDAIVALSASGALRKWWKQLTRCCR